MIDNLVILWTNADPLTAEHMVFMYAKNAKTRGWWKNVTLVIWGATAKLVTENEDIQRSINELKKSGVKVSGCVSCARQLGVAGDLFDLGIELIKWGEPLTDAMKDENTYLMSL